jgi:hypothetical protein
MIKDYEKLAMRRVKSVDYVGSKDLQKMAMGIKKPRW